MALQTVNCSECGRSLPLSFAGGEGRTPCPDCGATTIHVAVAVSDSAHVTESASWTARTTNAAATRRRQLELALNAVEASVEANNVSTAQDALKQALEAIHELADCLARGEWTQDGWDADELGLWYAHIGARNAAHHESSALAELHSHGARDTRLLWAMPVSVRSARQTTEYRTRLAGHPVLPALSVIVGRVSTAVS